MTTTVFYSWQNDLPNRVNRNFIEHAVNKALKEIVGDWIVSEAERGGLPELDKDTKGVPGIPPIADVIFNKISKSTVFVPDLSFVGKTANGRLIPNPNVLIEYGWALSALGYKRIVPVMNTAFGAATSETLPFDMRHLRRPIVYSLAIDATLEKRKEVKDGLVKQLVDAIRLVYEHHDTEVSADTAKHQLVNSTVDPSTFLNPDELLGSVRSVHAADMDFEVPGNEHLFLRLIPTIKMEELASSKKARDLMANNRVIPFSDQPDGRNIGRNRYGGFVCAYREGKVRAFTQLFRNRELWGLDAYLIDKTGLMDRAGVNFGFFPCSTVENAFIQTLSSYLPFCRDVLKIPLPMKFIAGATRVKGYRMAAPRNMGFGDTERFAGDVVDDSIVYEGQILDYESDSTKILRPFFDHLWDECGLSRPDNERL